MIYSVHNPMQGGFDYYEAPSTVPINDDHSTPRYPAHLQTKLGVPASMAGRPLPAGARLVGHGQTPKGSISSGEPGMWMGTKKSDIPSGLGEYFTEPTRDVSWPMLGAAAVAGSLAVWGLRGPLDRDSRRLLALSGVAAGASLVYLLLREHSNAA